MLAAKLRRNSERKRQDRPRERRPARDSRICERSDRNGEEAHRQRTGRAVAAKRVIAFQIAQEMEKCHLSKSELATLERAVRRWRLRLRS